METNRRDGYARNGHNRKRRYRDEDDGFDRRTKRRHYDEPAYTKLRKHLIGLAESGPKQPEDEISGISALVTDNVDDEQLRTTFLDTTSQLIAEQPLKIPFLAAIVEVVNAKNAGLAEEAIKKICGELNIQIQDGKWREAKLSLRYLACLQNILSGAGIFPVLDELFARAADLQTASAEDGLGLEIVKVILLTVAYAMKVSPSNKNLATLILEKTEIIATAPHSLDALVSPFVSSEGPDPVQARSFIGLLQQQLQNEALSQWSLKCLPRLQKSAVDGKKHDLPKLSIPTNVTSKLLPRLPEVYISLYNDQDVETVPPESNIASSLIRDSLVDTINVMDFNRTAAAKALIDIDCYFESGTFVKRATPFDKLREQESGRSSWKSEDVAIDAVFSQLLMLPFPEHKLIYFHSLLTEACKIAPAAIAPSLGRAIRFLYKNLGNLDLEVAFRFIDWFSHHLSNFGFTWKWTEWVEDLTLPAIHPKKAFIAGTLDKEIRLSFSQRIRGTLPDEYLMLIPDSKDKDIPDYKYNSDDVPYSQHARELLRLVRQKGQDQDVQEHILAIEKEAENLLSDPLLASTDVYVTCICFAGAKSLSHVLNCIERCKERLLSIANKNEAARLQIIDSVLEYWKDKPGVGVNIIDKLLNYTILSPLSVIQWALVANLQRGEILVQTHIYEMVFGTIDKVARRIRQIVTGRRQPTLTTQQRETLQQALASESDQFKKLFTVLEDTLRSLSSTSQDEILARTEGIGSDEGILEAWGRRWLKTASRKLAIEQAWVSDMISKPLPEPEPLQDAVSIASSVNAIHNLTQAEKAINGNEESGTSRNVDGNIVHKTPPNNSL